MAGSDTEIQLIAQRLQAVEKTNSVQSRQIEELSRDNHNLKGMQAQQDKTQGSALKMAGPAISIVAALVATIIGGVIWGGVDKNAAAIAEDQVEIAQRFERKDQRVAALKEKQVEVTKELDEARKHLQETKQQLAASDADFIARIKALEKHAADEGHPDKMIARLDVIEGRIANISVPSTSKIKEQLVNITTRMAAIEAYLTADEGKFNENREAIVAAQAAVKALEAITTEHEEELDEAEIQLSALSKELGTVRASSTASFTEVETQLRGLSSEIQMAIGFINRDIRTVWSKAFGFDLSEADIYKSDIPAKATTQVGKINGQ